MNLLAILAAILALFCSTELRAELGAESGAGSDSPPPPMEPQHTGGPPGAQMRKGGNPSGGGSSTKEHSEEDYIGTPYSDYAVFDNQEDVEDSDTHYFQYGRFFGISLGVGTEMVGGNRGQLWSGGFPMIDFKVHYWFDFNFALDLGFYTASQYYNTTVNNQGHVDVSMLWVGLDVKYYLPVKNLSAALTFASPYLSIGAGAYTKTQNSNTNQTQDQDTEPGVSLGGGLEFALNQRQTYFQLEGKMHIIYFKDTYSTQYSAAGDVPFLPDLTGMFFTVTGNIMFTW